MENKNSKVHCIDASIKNADWVKKTWDLPELGSVEFIRWFKRSGMTMDAFRALPVYRLNKQLDMFPPPPIVGSDQLVPITTKTGMLEEMLVSGAEFDDFWNESVEENVAYFFKWLGEFRATVLVVWGDEGPTHIESVKAGSLSLTDEERQSVRDEVTRLFQEAAGKDIMAGARQLVEEESLGFPSIPEPPANRLKRHGVTIEWKTWTSVPNVWSFGHGIHFHDNSKQWDTSLVAWIEGYEWLNGNPETIHIWCIAPDEVTTPRILAAMKKSIEAKIKNKKLPCGNITRRIKACPNS